MYLVEGWADRQQRDIRQVDRHDKASNCFWIVGELA